MDSSLFRGKHVIIQGITGDQGRFHAHRMVTYGTHVVAGTSPNKAGTEVEGIPVFASIAAIQQQFTVDISVVFVPAPFAKAAILEAIDAEVPLIVCITEHIPVHDMLVIRRALEHSKSHLVGPNSPGTLTPGGNLLGIIPANLSAPGDTAIVSRSGTLTYEAMSLLARAGFGQRVIVGIGGDMVRGTSFVDCLNMFERDPHVKRVVMIGEIGGTDEIIAADYIKAHVTKPVYAYIAGHSAPVGIQMGHAGAILGTNSLESADAKAAYLRKSGVTVASSITGLVEKIT